MQDYGDPRLDPARGNATEKVAEETGSAGPSYVGQGEDISENEAAPATSPYPTFTQDQMLRSQAVEYATRNSSGTSRGAELELAKKYYDFLKGDDS